MKVLVLEDEADLRKAVVRALSEAGYTVEEAADGEEGLYKVLNLPYSLIVMDIMLPKVDGWEILAKLRKEKSTPVLILTARDSIKERVRGLNSGADDYLVKPFDLEELLARVQSLIRRSAGVSHPVINLSGGITIDTGARVVSLNGVPVEVTAREYALIEMLALQRGKVVSRTQLYDHLFAEDDESFSNLLDVHIYNLRKKLGKDSVKTRRGHGYSID